MLLIKSIIMYYLEVHNVLVYSFAMRNRILSLPRICVQNAFNSSIDLNLFKTFQTLYCVFRTKRILTNYKINFAQQLYSGTCTQWNVHTLKFLVH